MVICAAPCRGAGSGLVRCYRRGGRNARSNREFWMSKHSNAAQNDGTRMSKLNWFPYKDHFQVDEETSMGSAAVIETLSDLLLQERKQRFDSAIANRTFSIAPVVEGLHDLGNIQAVFRTAEAFGMQSVHVVLNNDRRNYKTGRRISMGTEKWLDVEIWDTTKDCVDALRSRGYRVAATDMGNDTVPIQEMDWTIPTAVILGNEKRGISEEAASLADVKCNIPILGMVDSFNVSVAAGMIMYHAVNDRITRAGTSGDLTQEEQQILRAEFYLRHRRDSKNIIDELILTRTS